MSWHDSGIGRRAQSVQFACLTGIVAFVAAACDPSHYLAIVNAAPADIIVRVTETEFEDVPDIGRIVTTFAVPQGEAGELFSRDIGALEGSIEILSLDCETLATLNAQGGSVIEVGIDYHTTIRYTGEGDVDRFTNQIPPATENVCGDPPNVSEEP